MIGPASTASLDTVAACIDSFEVSGLTTGNTVPKICGENMGQHSKYSNLFGRINFKEITLFVHF